MHARIAAVIALTLVPSLQASSARAQSQAVITCVTAIERFDNSAYDLCDQALKVSGLSDADRAQALVGRGMASTLTKNYLPAINDFTDAIRLDGNIDTAYLMRGMSYRYLGKDDLAIADFAKSIELQPGLYAGYSDRAELLMKRQDWAGALVDFNHVVTILPKDPGTLFRRGYVHEKLGQTADADADYAAARALDPHIDDEMRLNGIVPGS